MSVLGMLAWCAAAVSLWLGARGHDGAIARGYRWLAGAAALYCAGLIISELVGGTLNPAPGLGSPTCRRCWRWPPWRSASPP